MSLLNIPYRVLKKTAKLAGFSLVIEKLAKKGSDYGQVLPRATYSPWLNDGSFNETYQIIRHYTMVDQLRCYELWQLVEQSAKPEGALIEIGVWRGGSGALIAKKAKLSGIKEKVYLCDTFKGVVKAGGKDSKYKGGEHADTSVGTVEEIVRKLKLDNVTILEGIFPDESAHLVTDKKFRFCHIDVDVYDSAAAITEWIWPKLTVGGIVVFDDYGFVTCDGITRFVNEQRLKKDTTIIHNLNGHAVLIKTSDT